MSKSKFPAPTRDASQAEAQRLRDAATRAQPLPDVHRGKAGRFKRPLRPDGKTPPPAEEGGIGRDDLA